MLNKVKLIKANYFGISGSFKDAFKELLLLFKSIFDAKKKHLYQLFMKDAVNHFSLNGLICRHSLRFN